MVNQITRQSPHKFCHETFIKRCHSTCYLETRLIYHKNSTKNIILYIIHSIIADNVVFYEVENIVSVKSVLP